MPTARTLTVLLIAALLYFFANQTQVGWLYMIAAALIGLVPAAWWFGSGALRRLHGERRVESASGEIYEGDLLHVRLTLHNTARSAVYQIKLTETCPFADAEHRITRLFLPALSAGASVTAALSMVADRRGLHEYPPLELHTRAPFGFFRHKYRLAIPSRILVYPEVRSVNRLSLLDVNQALLAARPRSGVGSEVIGSRPYRFGDSPRHLQWRAIARTGQLISKEFADESQPGLTLVLDLFAHPYTVADSKHTPFEWAVKVAATVGDYARRRNYPLRLRVDDQALPAPAGAVAWDALLQYLARVQPTGQRPVGDLLHGAGLDSLVAAVLPFPDPHAADALIALKMRGYQVWVVLIDPVAFPEGGPSAAPLAQRLSAAGIETRFVRFGQDWTEALVHQIPSETA